MQKKYNRFKKLKLQKREKKKKEEERKRKKNSTKLQKPNVEGEVYNNNRKCE